MTRFLSDDLIGALSPGGSGFERDPTVRQMLEQAGTPLAQRFDRDPAVRGGIHAALGDAWRTLGDRERAASHLRQAVQDYGRAFGVDDAQTLITRYGLVRTLAYAGTPETFAEGARQLEEADRLAGKRGWRARTRLPCMRPLRADSSISSSCRSSPHWRRTGGPMSCSGRCDRTTPRWRR